MKKKLVSLMLVAAMAASVAGTTVYAADTEEVVLTIFNSKSEIQDAFVEVAEQYSESHPGVKVEVSYSSDTVAAHMATRYASKEPYALAMVDAKDIYSLGPDHALDMTGEDWTANTTLQIDVDGKTLGFPVCVEARGLMYNADAIEAITGTEFNPADYTTLDAFKELIETLKEGGMDEPVAIMKEDWSLAAHFLAEVYEEQEDVDACIEALYAGEFDMDGNEKFNSLFDTFDVLKENNIHKTAAVAAVREDSEMFLAEGDIAFMFGGNWDWSLIKDFDPTENMGMMGVPENGDNSGAEYLVGGGSKYFMIDNTVSEAQQQAAKDFLNWLVFDEAGNAFLTERCALVPAYSNISTDALDPLSKSVKAYADADKLIPSYNYAPDDHYAKLGASMQKYLAGEIDRAGLAAEIVDYWKNTTPVAH